MPDFKTFRMNKVLLGESFIYRRRNPCLDENGKNNPVTNPNIKCSTVITETIDTYSEWIHYIRYCSKIDLK